MSCTGFSDSHDTTSVIAFGQMVAQDGVEFLREIFFPTQVFTLTSMSWTDSCVHYSLSPPHSPLEFLHVVLWLNGCGIFFSLLEKEKCLAVPSRA